MIAVRVCLYCGGELFGPAVALRLSLREVLAMARAQICSCSLRLQTNLAEESPNTVFWRKPKIRVVANGDLG